MKNLGTRFFLPIGLIVILFFIFILYRAQDNNQRHATELINQQAAIAIEFNLAIRRYAGDYIRPIMEGLVGKDRFIPETMSTSFISRNIFEDVRTKFPNFIIKFSSDNPRNPINKAGPDEIRIIEYFRKNPQAKRKIEEIQIDGRHYLAHFAPRWLKPECMHCHGDPKDAPAELLKRYGAVASFKRKVGDIVGLDTVAIPMETIAESLALDMRRQSVTLFAGLVLLFIAVMVIFRFVVTRRLAGIAEHFREITANPESRKMTKIKVTGNDEISVVGTAFNKLVEQLQAIYSSLEIRVNQRTTELTKANEDLRQEVEERQRAEMARQESEERYRRIFETSTLGVFQSTPEGKVITVNPAFIRMFGYDSIEDFISTVKDVAADIFADPQRRSEIIRLMEENPDLKTFENLYRRKDGSTFTGNLHVWLVKDPDGRLLRVEGFIEDITYRKQMEAEFLKMRTLESMGTLAGGIAHDFNNLLMAVTGYASLARMSLSPDDDASQYLAEAERVSLAGKELTQKLITFSKGGAPFKKMITLNQLVQENSGMILAHTAIQCEYLLGDNLFSVAADEEQIKQVIQNVVLNAKEAIPHGGVITISTNNTTLAYDDPLPLSAGDYVKISIRDNGTGIKEEDIPKVFDPYFTTKEMGAKRGMGLGLTVVYSIIKRHNGHIEIESKPNTGTSVHIYLPAYTKVIDEEAKDSLQPHTRGKVIFMDDEENIREIGGKFITHMGYEVVLTRNGAETIGLYKEALHSDRPFDAVILDLTIKGGMGGKETLRKLLSIDPNIKAIISSGYTDDPVIASYADYGFKGAITKPYKVEEMKKILEMVMKEKA